MLFTLLIIAIDIFSLYHFECSNFLFFFFLDPLKNISISQTSYREHENTSLICNAAAANMSKTYRYSWLPGNQTQKKISIYLTKELNKKPYTCIIYQPCYRNNPVTSTIKLVVECKLFFFFNWQKLFVFTERFSMKQNKLNSKSIFMNFEFLSFHKIFLL